MKMEVKESRGGGGYNEVAGGGGKYKVKRRQRRLQVPSPQGLRAATEENLRSEERSGRLPAPFPGVDGTE